MIKNTIIHLICLLIFTLLCINLSAQKPQYWDEYYQGEFKRRATYYSLDEKDGNKIVRYYFRIEDKKLVRLDELTLGKAPLTKTYFYEDGKVRMHVQVQKNRKEELVKTMDPEGKVISETLRPIGNRQVYSRPSRPSSVRFGPEDRKELPQTYADGRPIERPSANHTGPITHYYDNGQKKFSLNYLNGERSGPAYVYHENGQLWFSAQNAGIPSKSWHPNGQLAIQTDSLLSPGRYGTFKWDSLGALRESFPTDEKGTTIDEHKYFYANGNIHLLGMQDAADGSWIWNRYDRQGEIIKTYSFKPKDETLKDFPSGPAALNEATLPYDDTWLAAGFPSLFGSDSVQIEAPYPINIENIKLNVGYPQIARDKGIQGSVVFSLLIDHKGIPVYSVLLNQVHPYLSQSVDRYIMDLRFSPGNIDGKPFPFWVNIPFNFKLLDTTRDDGIWNFKRKNKKKKKQ